MDEKKKEPYNGKETSFADAKLTPEEFVEKYWKIGGHDVPYQYHTMKIEDGRDEQEQLIINNIRAIWNLLHTPKAIEQLSMRTETYDEQRTKWGENP